MKGSRMDSGRTGGSVAWRDPEYKTRMTYLGTNKEVLHADLYAIGEAPAITLGKARVGR